MFGNTLYGLNDRNATLPSIGIIIQSFFVILINIPNFDYHNKPGQC